MGTGATTFALTAALGTTTAGFLGEFVPLTPLLMTQVVMYGGGGVMVLLVLGRGSRDVSPQASPAGPGGTPAG